MEKDAEKERERKAWAFTMHFESVKYRYIYADGWMCAYGRKCHRCRSCLGALLESSTLHHQITKKRKISKFESFFSVWGSIFGLQFQKLTQERPPKFDIMPRAQRNQKTALFKVHTFYYQYYYSISMFYT